MEIFIIDQDHRRRAQLAYDLHAEGVFATPVDPADAPIAPKNGVSLVLCHDAGNGPVELANQIGQFPSAPITVFYSAEICLRDVVTALRASAIEYFEWPDEEPDMIAFVKHTLAATAGPQGRGSERADNPPANAPAPRNGQQPLLPKQSSSASWLGEFVRKSDARQRLKCLSVRELEVLRLVANGLPSNVIARNLGISPRTVESHRANILSKTQSQTTAEIVRFAIEGGIV